MLMRPATSLIGVSSGSRPWSSASVSYATPVEPLASRPSVSSLIGREVEIREDDLALADFLDLFLLRLLHLHDHVCPGEDFVGAFDQFGAGVLIFAIRQAGTGAGARFDEHLMAAAR